MESIACAMSSADRVAVPLKSMCSTKCAMPLCAGVSWWDPRISQTPMLTDRTCGIDSVMRRRPLSRTSRVTMRLPENLSPPGARRSLEPHASNWMVRSYWSCVTLQCYHAESLRRKQTTTGSRAARRGRLTRAYNIGDHHGDRNAARYRGAGACRARRGRRGARVAAVSRSPAVQVDLQARRDGFRRDDRPEPRLAKEPGSGVSGAHTGDREARDVGGRHYEISSGPAGRPADRVRLHS